MTRQEMIFGNKNTNTEAEVETNEPCKYVLAFIEELQSRPLTEGEGELILYSIMNAEEGKQEEAREEAYSALYYLSFDGGYTDEEIYDYIAETEKELEKARKEAEEKAKAEEKMQKYIAKMLECYAKELAIFKKWENTKYKKAYGNIRVGYKKMSIESINHNRKLKGMQNAISNMEELKKDLEEVGYDTSGFEKYYVSF